MVVALSVAALPATAGFAAGNKAKDATVSVAMPDCEHHRHAPAPQKQNTADDGACVTACTLSCFGFTATGTSAIAVSPPASAALKPVRTSSNISSRMGSPPFRPPRS